MKKNVFGRQFSRDKNERQALFKNLISSLILKERIRTTEAKAKSIKRDVDKIITKFKKNKNALFGDLVNPRALEKLVKDMDPQNNIERFTIRNIITVRSSNLALWL